MYGNYDDMLDMARREADPDYVSPTRAYTAQEWIEGCEEHGEDVMIHVMEKDMDRFEKETTRKLQARIAYLEDRLDEEGVDY